MFCSSEGNLIDDKNFLNREFFPLLKRAKVPRIRFHDLRHTTATLMLAKNVHAVVVQRLLGHSTITLTIDAKELHKLRNAMSKDQRGYLIGYCRVRSDEQASQGFSWKRKRSASERTQRP
ncbi:MAG: tyrosine-type recombinase/integrase [Vulcanimicrobiaceae bacterium]